MTWELPTTAEGELTPEHIRQFDPHRAAYRKTAALFRKTRREYMEVEIVGADVEVGISGTHLCEMDGFVLTAVYIPERVQWVELNAGGTPIARFCGGTLPLLGEMLAQANRPPVPIACAPVHADSGFKMLLGTHDDDQTKFEVQLERSDGHPLVRWEPVTPCLPLRPIRIGFAASEICEVYCELQWYPPNKSLVAPLTLFSPVGPIPGVVTMEEATHVVRVPELAARRHLRAPPPPPPPPQSPQPPLPFISDAARCLNQRWWCT
jgi:hypothetical protein